MFRFLFALWLLSMSFFEAVSQHACGKGCVPGKERGWEKLLYLVQGITPIF